MQHEYRMLVGGVWSQASSGEWIESINPSDRTPLARVARGVEADVDRAVAAAREALRRRWQQVEPADRGRLLYDVARRIRDEAEALARLESLDNGKPLSQARTDVQVAARYFEYYGGVADKLLGETIPLDRRFLDYTLREPLGVTAHIIPWNYPLQIAARSIAPALATGNTVVVKPAEEASLTTLELGRILTEAGLPAGVVNIVPGYGEDAGAHLAGHPDVNLVAFTGSVATGTLVMRAAAENVTPVLLELGGKSPNILFADAELDRAIPVIMRSIYQNAGQTCSAGSRLLVERSVHDRVVEEISRRSRALRLGPGIEDPDLGPIISEAQWQRVLEYVEVARREGAQVATGGRVPGEPRLAAGFFVEPTVLTEVRPEMRVAREEIFGPVLAVLPFDDPDEAAQLANDTPYGLTAGIWTRDIQVAHRLAAQIEAGQVFINTYGAGGGVEMPFGGYKRSGFGREKGLEALRHYTQVKNVCVALE